MEGRDKKKYRNKGARQTTVKTVYGEVTYQRTVYEVTEEDGTRHFVYLLDETLELDHVGLISTNMAELLVKGITELSYRECARQVSEMTGQTISAMGVWNVIQALGEKVCEDEAELTEAYKKGQVKGKREVPVLFEEADGVYIKLQGKDRKKEKQDKSEIKIGIAYDGWRKTGPDRYALENKVVVAGFSKAKEFQEYREAASAVSVSGTGAARPTGGSGIPEHGNNGKPCVERDSEADETWAQKLEPARREPSGEDTGKKVQRETV